MQQYVHGSRVIPVRHSWNSSIGTEQAQSPSFSPTLYIQIEVDYSHWDTTSTLGDPIFVNLYMLTAHKPVDPFDLYYIYLPAANPFPLPINAHLRGTVNVVIRRVIIPSWRDFLGLQPVCVVLSCKSLRANPSSELCGILYVVSR